MQAELSAGTDCPLAAILAARLRAEKDRVVERWLDRILARVTLSPGEIFPTDDILDHIPLLIEGIADYLEDPVDEITTDIPVLSKAMELGALRHAQGFEAYEILKEYEILGGVLFDFLIRSADSIDEPCTRGQLLECGRRVFRAITVIQQFTTTHFLHLAEQQVRQREDRLRRFNRAVSHGLKGRMGALIGAAAMLKEDHVIVDPDAIRRYLSMITSNVTTMNQTLVGLIDLSSSDEVGDQGGHVLLAAAAEEVKHQLQTFAAARGVRVEIADDLPAIEIPAAAVELVLSNYISNAVKYSDPDEADRWVLVGGSVTMREDATRELEVRVEDNGLGVPESARERLFQPFFRAHERVVKEEGSGIGLSLVRQTVDDLGGRTWARFDGTGSQFGFSIPLSRNTKAQRPSHPRAKKSVSSSPA